MAGPSPSHSIAVIAGDGIGQETVPAGLRCLEAVGVHHSVDFMFTEYDWGSDYFGRHGRMMPADGLEQLSRNEAIFLGAVGTPDIDDVETLWGLLIPIRRAFDQYVNVRPVRSLPGVTGPLQAGDAIDFIIVRENCEGEYSEVGGVINRGRESETAIQETVFTRVGVRRIAQFACDLAARRSGRLVSATKSNGIIHTMPFWDAHVRAIAEDNGLDVEPVLIDALAARMVLSPASLDVVVASNLFGDILSDLGSALTGSIGVAPSANLNPERRYPSLFEPVHGSAPDIAGRGIANPIGQIWSAALMLEHLGHPAASAHLVAAFESVLEDGVMTRDLGGTATTNEVTEAVIEALGRDRRS